MTSENPYNAPSAPLVTASEPLEGDLSQAVNDFIVTRRFIRVLAVLSIVVLVFSAIGLVVSAMAPSQLPRSTQLIGIAWIVVLYGLAGVVLYRLSTPLYALAEAKTWDNVTFVFQRMTQTWGIGIASYILGFVGGIAMRFIGPMAVIAGVTPSPSDTVRAAQQLRNVLRIFVGIAALAAIANIVLTAVAPLQSQMALGPAFIWSSVIFGLVLQAVVVFFVWRHVPALDAFIAQPSAATLTKVAHAHRMLWRLALIGVYLTIGIAFLGIIAAIAIPMMYRHK